MSELHRKLDEARQEIGPIVRAEEGQVGTRRYKYANLNGVLETVEPILRSHGLALFQTVQEGHQVTDAAVVTELRLLDTDETIRCEIPLPDTDDPQRMGSAITYYRRYGAVTLLGLLTEEDDDGATAVPRTRPHVVQVPESPPPVELAYPKAPEGWASDKDSFEAHEAVRARLGALSDAVYAQQAREWVGQNGWPLAPDKLEELEGILKVAEGFTPASDG